MKKKWRQALLPHWYVIKNSLEFISTFLTKEDESALIENKFNFSVPEILWQLIEFDFEEQQAINSLLYEKEAKWKSL